ncbi:prothoracicostatic peptide [Caerostris darwini]|uniref:Prothoracicostatic peptide n=1 Tax=Caerostris darwini TaxID=1538125 RepID=A0AAV4S7A2_9ARAC|nr:prothoracicostatic peptide [Caerostris darwini]
MHNTLLLAFVFSLFYIALCNSRLPDETSKSDGSPSTADLEPIPEQLDSSLLSSEEDLEKRGWEKLSNVWGKRADWNKLNGMWGKRADWNKLNGMWGKRTSSRDDGSKRTTQWNNLKSVWGKRADGEWDVPAVWDAIPDEGNII